MPSTQRRDRSTARPGRDAVGLVLAWGLIFAVVVAVGFALTGPLRGSVGVGDNHVERWFARHRSPALTAAAQAVSLLGETWTVLVLVPVLMLVIWLWRRRIRPVLFLAVACIGEIAGYLLTVSIVSRPRPPVIQLDKGLDPSHSYPSGHVAAAMATYGGMAVLIWAVGRHRWRWWSAVLLLLPPLVALARLYLGAHHPTDAAISLVFMSAWLAVTAAALLLNAPAGRA